MRILNGLAQQLGNGLSQVRRLQGRYRGLYRPRQRGDLLKQENKKKRLSKLKLKPKWMSPKTSALQNSLEEELLLDSSP
jgi:hypothetical protein